MDTSNNRLIAGRMAASPFIRGALYYSSYWGCIGIIDPYLNVYFTHLGIKGAQIGVISSLFPLMNLVYAPFITSLADQKAWRVRILALCCFGLSFAYIFLGFSFEFWGILIFTLIVALLRSPIASLGDSIIARFGIRYGTDYGKMRLWGSIVYAFTTIGAGYLWGQVGMRWMFFVAGICFLIVVVSALLLEEEGPVVHQSRGPWKLLQHDKVLLALFVATVFLGASLPLGGAFGGMYMEYLGGGELMIGLLVGLGALSEAPMMHIGNTLMKRMGGMQALFLSYGLLAAGLFGSMLAWSPWVLLIMGVIKGFGFGLFFVSTVVIFDRHAPDNWSASIQAMVNAGALGFAPFISLFVGGLIYDVWRPGVYACSVVLIILAMIALLFAIRWEKQIVISS